MKGNVLVILLFCGSLCQVYSQKSPEFGEVSTKELSEEEYKRDTASAIILFDIGSFELEPNSTIGTTYKRHLRIKILDDRLLENGAACNFY